MKAKGEFEVNLQPLDAYPAGAEGATLGRMSIEKIYRGDLHARSVGEMLSVITETAGSAGYVAVEKVIGALEGQSGTFVLQHFGIMQAGRNHLILEVVPDSGTGELAGLSGAMTIAVVDGRHLYEFDYDLGQDG